MKQVFEIDRIHEVTRANAGRPFDEMCEGVIADLAQIYPEHIESRQEWVFNLASGSTGIMTVLHGSLSEYLILFGTPIGTEAFSGRFPIDIWDFVLSGKMSTYRADAPGTARESEAGDRAEHPRGEVNGFKLDPGTWMLEYGRGFVPGALHTTLGDLLFRALDPVLLAQTVKVYGRLTLKELLQGKI